MNWPIPNFIKKRIVNDDEIDLSETALQGASSSSSAEGKQTLLYLGPIWIVFLINSFVNPYLSSIGYDPLILYMLSILFIVIALVGPVVTFQLIKTQKIQYLGGRDKHKVILGWKPEDFDIADMATKSDPIRVSIGGSLETKSFIDNMKVKLGEMRLNELIPDAKKIVKGDG